MEKFVYDFAYYIKNTFDKQSFIPYFIDEIVNYIYEGDESSNAYIYDKLFFEFLCTQNLSFEDYCTLDREKIIEYALLLLNKEFNKF